jgi:hypothetical protein
VVAADALERALGRGVWSRESGEWSPSRRDAGWKGRSAFAMSWSGHHVEPWSDLTEERLVRFSGEGI